MTATKALKAVAREKAGKGAARALRREGKIPAVIYGGKKPPVAIALDGHEMFRLLHAGGFKTTVFEIDTGAGVERAIPRDYQRDVVKDTLLHVDFFRVSATSKVHVDVPVHFVNEDKAPGLKRGGVLNIVRHAVEVTTDVGHLPEHIEVDLSGLNIGDSLHASAVKLPEGVRFAIEDRDFTIATIAAPTVPVEAEEPAEAETEAAAEPEGEAEAGEGETPAEG
ncbi:50S ribosomal protein L25/general stress protein Ctc [Hansschlegelia sp.]|uniref:50S ribosomal protein L25/general stress protein Ctc n=1 Tax=Hansschlegelia sp. TaxID=2041892 RepID=UPI002C6F2107|nr:50S ribosomal protein L25/general stress protein Ctc [Hansschlegelia sp.]HVI27701.1 50S ribosomal protein L25/general stress protein Ctc [Hansschlegelia sp.]